MICDQLQRFMQMVMELLEDDMPGALVFSTTPDGSASPYNQERMRITASGHLSELL